MFDLFNPSRWIIGVLVAASVVVGYVAWERHQQGVGEDRAVRRYETAITIQKTEARQTLAAETARVRTAEQALIDFKNQQEIIDAKNQSTVAGLDRRLRAATDTAGRLRDPNQTGGCGVGSGGATNAAGATANDRAADGANGAGLFSKPATDLFIRLTREADDINLAYIRCRAQALNDRALAGALAEKTQ